MFESQYACYHLPRVCNSICRRSVSLILHSYFTIDNKKKATRARQIIKESIELGLQFYRVFESMMAEERHGSKTVESFQLTSGSTTMTHKERESRETQILSPQCLPPVTFLL